MIHGLTTPKFVFTIYDTRNDIPQIKQFVLLH